MINMLLGLVLRRLGDVKVGRDSFVRWWGLRSCRRNSVRIGSDSIIRARIDFDSSAGEIRIGDRCFIGKSHLVCHSKIDIGDDVVISWGVTIVDHNSHSVHADERRDDIKEWARGVKNWKTVSIAPVVIEDKVWIGFNAIILKGVQLGEGVVVGAGAVVTKSVPPYCIVAGNPARVIRQLHGRVDQQP